MNPFKQKQLDEFTVTDCEQYIAHYPYGEHILDVKKLLKQLKKEEKLAVKPKEVLDDTEKLTEPSVRKKKPRKKTQQVTTNNYTAPSSKTDDSNDILKTVFAWIGIIVVTIIVGTIIISILNEILPYNWWNKYRYIIYPVVMAIGRWIQEKID